MDSEKPLIFISYEDAEARDYAVEAKGAFEACGFRAWVWDSDRPRTGEAREEMARNIRDCNHFAHICTKGSERSRGQRIERRLAYGLEKDDPPLLLTFDESYIPLVYKGHIYNIVSPRNFREECRKVAEDLLRQQRLEAEVRATEEGESI